VIHGPTFTASEDGTAIEIADPIENARFELRAPTSVEPTPVPADDFYFPVDSAVAIETPAVGVPKLMNVYVRTQDGDLVADNADREDRTLGPGAYTVELTTAPMKLYLSVESGLELRHDELTITLAFDDPTEVRIGARSFHDRPAGTVTTTAGPVGAMEALSYLGSALKTTSCERSFPTLREHPPLIEVGEEFDVPEGLERPEVGVRLELPPEYECVYPAASLAYYLGAEVVPGDDPRLVTDEGFEYDLAGSGCDLAGSGCDLAGPRGYEETVGRVLRQTFFLDCVTRTEGYYRVDLHERNAVDLDFAALYDASLAERLEAYLSVPFEAVEAHVPDWNLTTDVMATPDNAEMLPFVANDLALVRCPGTPSAASVSATPEPLTEFFRSTPGDQADAAPGAIASADASGEFTSIAATGDDFTRSTTSESSSATTRDEIFNPEPAETVEHAWVGEGVPVGANKTTVESYRRRVEWSAPEKTSIEIDVVCNDDRMREESVVEEFYGLRDLLRFDVSVHYGLATDELRDLLAEPADFLHYIGHVGDRGMRCPDGPLDACTLPEVNVKAFVLNACRSYEQGEALVESGSYGGVVTLAEVANSYATDIGQTLARLLNCGFSLRVALCLVKDTIAPAYQYTTVGDGGLTLCQSESGIPVLAEAERQDDGRFDFTVSGYPVPGYGIGSFQQPHIDDTDTLYLASGPLDTFELSVAEVDEFLDLEILPVIIDGTLYWSDEIDLKAL
jgi:hypothetical protein